jgi:hypothetical protein
MTTNVIISGRSITIDNPTSTDIFDANPSLNVSESFYASKLYGLIVRV